MTSELQAVLLAQELELLMPEARHSEARLRELLADDFVEFGSSGRVFDRTTIIQALVESPATEQFAVEDFRLVTSSDDTAFVTYRCVARSDSGEIARTSNRSSLWRRAGDAWQLLFHQGTKSE